MSVNYDKAFSTVIADRWRKISDEQQKAAKSPNRQGQLESDAPASHALYDCYNYQRGHADVFREAYRKSRHSPPSKGERLLVVDIGAGAATVAVALSEALKRSQRHQIEYRAFDPNPMMRKLGSRMLKHLGADFRSACYIGSLEDMNFTNVDRLLFTFSYVAHQDTVMRDDIKLWVSTIKRAVAEVGQSAELIYTTAALSEGALVKVRQMLVAANILKRQYPIDVQVPRRFPFSDSGKGPLRWSEQPKPWDVQAEHWILRT